ncbi:MAG: hypothetical protein P8Y24_07305 [Gammaproteobacteria bacterium]
MKIKSLFFFMIVAIPAKTMAEDYYFDNEFRLGFSMLDMNYKEFDDTNFLLDREDGFLPGVTGEFKFTGQNADSYLFASYHTSTIDYDGHTQGGIPVQTDTETDIIDVQYRLNAKSSKQHQMYGGIGYRFWRRDIQSTGNVSGILEHYTWSYGMLGVKSRFFKDYNSELSLDFRITHMLEANMDIDFKGFSATGFAPLDDKSVNLGKKTNFRISLPWRIKYKNLHTWIIEPYFEKWDIGKSNVVNLTENGVLVVLPECGGVCGVLEPRSETRNIGVNFQVVVPF